MPINPTTKVSGTTYYQNDNSDMTTIGVENSFKVGNGNVSVYTGVGETFDGKPMSAIIDVKGGCPYGNIGNVEFSGGFRVRNNLGENSQSVQFRVQPCTATLPVGNTTNIYATPYVATKVNYQNGNNATTVGVFAGVSQKIGKNASVFVEGQIYDVSKIGQIQNNGSLTGINAGISIKI